MKTQKGITMIEVIVSIVVLLIIALLAVYMSKDSTMQAKATEVYAEMKAVDQAINTVRSDMLLDDSFSLEQGKHYDATTGEEDFYIIYGSLDDSNEMQAAKNIGLDSLKRNYIVNYETGEFKLQTAVDIKGNDIRTIREVKDLLDSGAI